MNPQMRIKFPKVSVCMPVYNTDPEHLKESMESILGQSFHDFEFLILNDCSSDPRVAETVRSYEDPRIVYAENPRNLGISGARNRLLDMAKGDYIAVMDHDDISLPERLEKEVAFLDEHPEVGLVQCQFQDMDGSKISHLPTDDLSLKIELMLHCGGMCHPTVLLRRSILEENDIRYEARFSPCEDHALFCRMISHTAFATLPAILFRYRAWEGNTSHKKAKQMEAGKEAVLEFARRENPDLWTMAQCYLKETRRYRFLGLPILSRIRTRRSEKWLLFNFLPIWTWKDSLPRIKW